MRTGWKLALGGGLLLLTKAAFAGGHVSPRGEKAKTTEEKRLAFVSDLWEALGRVIPDASTATKQLIITNASYEVGYGSGTAYRLGNNAFNITRGNTSGPFVDGPDLECDADNNCKPITQKFRAYNTLDASIQDYLDLLRNEYQSAYSLLMAGDIGFVAALGNAGYYTQPVDIYVKNFRGVLKGVQKRLADLNLVV